MDNGYQMTGSLHLPSGPDLKNKQKQKQVLERQLHSEASSSNSLETSLWGLTEVREDLGAYSGISPDDGYQVMQPGLSAEQGQLSPQPSILFSGSQDFKAQ